MDENEKPFFSDAVIESIKPSIQKITRLLNRIDQSSKFKNSEEKNIQK